MATNDKATAQNTPQANGDELDLDNLDWDSVQTEIVETHAQGSKTKVIVDVPAKIVALAQESRNSKKVVTIKLPTEKIAANFEMHMRNAGPHVKPEAGMFVKREKNVVQYSAGNPRGRKPLPGVTPSEGESES